uniref:DNA-directed RNA polymerase subunit beta'' n=1 Tax=Lacunastrum gracillimum TaxID=427913 RepID=A0A2U8GGZ0_9CHLO|nr:RNA polymerase beta subunit [Lacunastrum gracillimum]AWI68013.1 RNA polymerase beta subunit [Lacunastrum gracillimum]
MQKLIFLIKKNKLVNNQTNKLNNIKKRTFFSTNVYLQIKNLQTKNLFCIKSTKTSIENFNIFWNCSFDKGRLKSFVSWFLNTYGEYKTIELLEQLKNLGFGYATKAGVSLGIDDLKIPPQKFDLINQAESKIFKGIEKYKKGQITGVERLQQLIDVWNQTSEFLKQEVIRYFETTDLFNPVYMMAFSGARGNVSQVRQLVGMRGLMSDPQGNIIDFPIQSNFREGLTLTEYIISTYGARKGIVDTALRTATAGYLTRRLVDVAQHVMISQFDCGTTRGIFLFDMKEGAKTIYSFQNRLIGRVLANDIESINKGSSSVHFGSLQFGSRSERSERSERADVKQIVFKKAYRNQEISASLAASIAKITKKAFVRSPLTCETRKLVCQLCYGWSLASSKLVPLGEAVGVIAAQSIGEPGTQLTMRTFHTGGVFSGGLTNQIIAPYDGYIEYLDTIPGTCIRTPQGDIAFLTKAQGSFFIKEKDSNVSFKNSNKKEHNPILTKENSKKLFRSEFYTIPAYAILFARNKEQIFKKQIVAQFSSIAQQQKQRGNAEQTVYAELEGQIAFFQIDLLEQKNEKLFEDIVLKAIDWSKIWILSGKIYYDPLGLNSFGINGDFFNRNATFQKIYWHNLNSCFLDIPLKKQKNKNFISKGIRRISLTENIDFLYKKRAKDYSLASSQSEVKPIRRSELSSRFGGFSSVQSHAASMKFSSPLVRVGFLAERSALIRFFASAKERRSAEVKKQNKMNEAKKQEPKTQSTILWNQRLEKPNVQNFEQKKSISNIQIKNFKLNKEKTIFFNKIPKNFYIKGFKNKRIFFLNKKFIYYYYINLKKDDITYNKNLNIKKTINKLSYFFLMNPPFDRFYILDYKTSLNKKVQKNVEILTKSKIVFSKFYNNKNARFLPIGESLEARFGGVSLTLPTSQIFRNQRFQMNLKNISYSKIKIYNKKENSFYNLKFIGMNDIYNIREIEDDLKKSLIEKRKTKTIAKKICSYYKKATNMANFKVLLKNNPYSPYIYPFRTSIRFFVFKKINRIHFLSYYMKKSLKSSVARKKKKLTFSSLLSQSLSSLIRLAPSLSPLRTRSAQGSSLRTRSAQGFSLREPKRKRTKANRSERAKEAKDISNSNTTKQKNIKKLMNPFFLKNSIPNFLKKKKIKKKIFSIITESEDSLKSQRCLEFLNLVLTSHEEANQGVSTEEANSEILQEQKENKEYQIFKNTKQKLKAQVNESRISKKLNFKSLFVSNAINKSYFNLNKVVNAFVLQSPILNNKSKIGRSFQIGDSKQSQIGNNQRFQMERKFKDSKKAKANNISNQKINDFYKRKPILTLPVNKISFKKLGYIFSINRHFKSKIISPSCDSFFDSAFHSFASTALSLREPKQSEPEPMQSEQQRKAAANAEKKKQKDLTSFKESKEQFIIVSSKTKEKKNTYCSKSKIKSDLILSYFPLTNSYNMPIDFSNINDPGKNYQKLSLGNTLNFSPFSNIAFRWFPANSQTISNGIYIWSKNFLINEQTMETDIQTSNKVYRENPDFYIKNYYFFQKKRWIKIDGLFKKYNKKEILKFDNSMNKLSYNMKNKSTKICYIFSKNNKESQICFNNKKLNNKLHIYEKFGPCLQIPYNLKFRYDLKLNQRLQIFVTKKYIKQFFSFNQLTFKELEDVLKIKMPFFNLITRFSKFSVYKQDFYYIPQENSRFNIWNFKEHNFSNILSSKFYLSNRQGLKKDLPSEISGLTRIYILNSNKKLKTKLQNQRQNKDKQFLISCLYNKKLINKKLFKKVVFDKKHKNKKHKNFISYIKINKASYNMDLNLRNKMSHNITYKIFKEQKNKKLQKNINSKKMKFSNFYKDYDFSNNFNKKRIKEKAFIAQLKNQSLFFSYIPFSSVVSFSSQSSSSLLRIPSASSQPATKEAKEIYNSKKSPIENGMNLNKSSVVNKQNEKFEKMKKMHKSVKSKPFISSCQVERIKKPGWVYLLIDSLNSFPLRFCFAEAKEAKKLKNNSFQSNEKLKIKNFLSFKFLHQTFVDPGKKIIHDICFEQNKIYIENVTLTRKLKNKQININKIYTNNNCRFFNGKISSMIFNENNFADSNKLFKKNNLALLLRPIQHKILPNPQLFKKEISNNQKNSYNSYSILFYKDFHSNLLNLQNCHKKSLSKFPSVDFQIHPVSHNINFFDRMPFGSLTSSLSAEFTSVCSAKKPMQRNKVGNSKIIQSSKKLKNNIKTSKTKLQANTIKSKASNKMLAKQRNCKSFITPYYKTPGKLKKQSYNNIVSFYMKRYLTYNTSSFFSNVFYSAYKMHSFSLELKNTKPLGFDFGFSIPTIILKPSYSNIIKQQNLNFLKRNSYISKKENNLSQMFYCLMKKNKLRKEWISKIFQNFPVDVSKSYKNKNWLNKYIAFSKNLQADLNPFFSFFYFYPFPFIEWSLSRKDNDLANNILSSIKKVQNYKHCSFPNSLSAEQSNFNYNIKSQNLKNTILNYKQSGILNIHSMNMQSFSFTFPLIKNSFLLYKAYNKILANQVYASTSLLSPFEGELLTQNNNNKWWNKYAETDLKHKNFNIKHYIFLTKKDIFSISLDLNSNIKMKKHMQQDKKMNVNEYLSLFSSLYSNNKNVFNKNIRQQTQTKLFDKLKSSLVHTSNVHLNTYYSNLNKKKYNILNFVTKYQNKIYKLKGLSIGKVSENKVLNLHLGKFLLRGDNISFDQKIDQTGQIIHLNSKKITLRYAQPFLISPKGILHVQQGDYIYRNAPIITLPFETLTTGDIVQGIPKVEQYLEARTTQNGRFFLYSLPVLQKAIFERYRTKLPLEQAVAQSFLKIQQIIVDGVQRVYRSQGVSIAEKHLEVIVKQMTSKVQIIHGGQTGFFPGELVDLEIVESVNKFLMVKIRYEPIVLGITRASLEVESFLSAASFQQTTKILAKASLSKKKDYLKGLKENLLVGNLIPAGTGFMNSY